jgi:hypothetical protein
MGSGANMPPTEELTAAQYTTAQSCTMASFVPVPEKPESCTKLHNSPSAGIYRTARLSKRQCNARS